MCYFHPEDRDDMFLIAAEHYLQNYMAPQPKRSIFKLSPP
jgi:hypothetical protein